MPELFKRIRQFGALMIAAIILGMFGFPALREIPISPLSARGIGAVPIRLRLEGQPRSDTSLRYILIRTVELPGYLAALSAPDVDWKPLPAGAFETSNRVKFGFASTQTLLGTQQTRFYYDETILVEYRLADNTLRYRAVPIPFIAGQPAQTVTIPTVPPDADSPDTASQEAF
jgi:hypothetical protein